ncbi:hypothetical protein EVJ58_g9390 [Rhodofomes roseus]|uniref:Uncharacterized protein n=1 Tax=Rhodofomes roseus TaxID=34475 RepID=A0A4Y9XYA6_9APHY|nr:hypothetical protein EVJ58_g9390 [Rhodofomes roseus]
MGMAMMYARATVCFVANRSDYDRYVGYMGYIPLELGQLSPLATLILVDNQSAMALAKNATFHDRTKHIAVRYHFIREKIDDGEVRVEYVPTGDQVADVLTKALAREKHERFATGMGLVTSAAR